MSDKLIFVGLDGEMSSPDLSAGGALIQIGAIGPLGPHIVKNGSDIPMFTSMIALPDTFLWDDSAESIHGIKRSLLETAPSAEEVDEKFYRWLLLLGAQENRRLCIPVGKNIGSFDMPFLHKYLPRSASLFARRSVDLNSLCFSMDGLPYQQVPLSAEEWKKKSVEFGTRYWAECFGESDWAVAHDAEFDAWVHGFMWEFLKAGMRGESLDMPEAKVPAAHTSDMIASLLTLYKTWNNLEKASGVPEVFLRGWHAGGRATRQEWLDALTMLRRSSER